MRDKLVGAAVGKVPVEATVLGCLLLPGSAKEVVEKNPVVGPIKDTATGMIEYKSKLKRDNKENPKTIPMFSTAGIYPIFIFKIRKYRQEAEPTK